jgi:hypothetical protein
MQNGPYLHIDTSQVGNEHCHQARLKSCTTGCVLSECYMVTQIIAQVCFHITMTYKAFIHLGSSNVMGHIIMDGQAISKIGREQLI